MGHCLLHLLRTNDLYLGAIDEALASTAGRPPGEIFRPGWLGSRFATWMGPRSRRRVRTLRIFEPSAIPLPPDVVERFVGHQDRLLAVLGRARSVDLTRTRIPSPASRLVRFRLGDALQLLVAHEERHVRQALRVLGEPGFPAA